MPTIPNQHLLNTKCKYVDRAYSVHLKFFMQNQILITSIEHMIEAHYKRHIRA